MEKNLKRLSTSIYKLNDFAIYLKYYKSTIFNKKLKINFKKYNSTHYRPWI